jgi:hypothetical protein
MKAISIGSIHEQRGSIDRSALLSVSLSIAMVAGVLAPGAVH